jgi:TetR/AcrR family transcriptional regulator, cholesterol catabolism regulator
MATVGKVAEGGNVSASNHIDRYRRRACERYASEGQGGGQLARSVNLAREDELIQKAIRLFSRGGFQKTSLQQIANELAITRPLFYYYFESKEDLLWRIIGHLGDGLLEQAEPIAIAAEAPPQRLRLIIEKHIETLIENVDAFRIYFAERHLLTGKRELRIKRGEVRYHDLIAGIIAEGQQLHMFRDGDPHFLTRLSVGTANSPLRWYRPSGSMAPRETIVAIADYILAGLAPEVDSPPEAPCRT